MQCIIHTHRKNQVTKKLTGIFTPSFVQTSILKTKFIDLTKLDEEFLARYNLNYGSPYVPPPPPPKEKEEEEKKGEEGSSSAEASSQQLGKRKRFSSPQEAQWFDVDESQNTKVYISNIPTDVTEDEFVEFMSKCGLIMKDVTTGKYKIKLYEENGCLKGDALCTYIKVDSVELALQILDGAYLKNNQVKVERAKFTQKGNYDPSKKPKPKKKKDKEKMKKKQEALFAWKPEKLRGDRPKNEKIVVIRNAFTPEDFNEHVEGILELKEDFRDEAAKLGTVRKVEIFDTHPEGVVQIFMSTHEDADAVVAKLNGRYFGGNCLSAELFDGITRFKTNETLAERDKRLSKWEKFIAEEDEDGDTEANKSVSRSPFYDYDDPETVTPPRDDD